MCGRYITTSTWAEYRRYLSILPPEVDNRNGPVPNYNTAPTDEVEIIGRCLVPASGYYEWRKESANKQPYLIRLPGDPPVFEPFAFAGIMSYNRALDLRSFAIVTLTPTPNISEIHNRMPFILTDDALSAWMDPETSKANALELLHANRGTDLVFHPVSSAVGRVQIKGPELIDEISPG